MDSLTVLIVDDEVELVSTLGERLELRNIRTQIATNGETALNIMKNSPPQVAVIDVMMPGVGGIDILDKMREQKINIPVILITGYGSKRKGKEGIERGAFDYLMKPVRIEELIAKMNDAVRANN